MVLGFTQQYNILIQQYAVKCQKHCIGDIMESIRFIRYMSHDGCGKCRTHATVSFDNMQRHYVCILNSLPQHGLLFRWHLIKYLVSSCYIIAVVNLFIKSSSERNAAAAAVITVDSLTEWFFFSGVFLGGFFGNRWLQADKTMIIFPVVISGSDVFFASQKNRRYTVMGREIARTVSYMNNISGINMTNKEGFSFWNSASSLTVLSFIVQIYKMVAGTWNSDVCLFVAVFRRQKLLTPTIPPARFEKNCSDVSWFMLIC